jgi:hypothetical protein
MASKRIPIEKAHRKKKTFGEWIHDNSQTIKVRIKINSHSFILMSNVYSLWSEAPSYFKEWMRSPLLSFGSNHVVFGGMT